MRQLRFLLTRRWVLLAAAVVALSTLAWQLGDWQFRRLDERRDRNDLVRTNEAAAPVPATDVLSPGSEPPEDAEWRLVTATGTYAPDETVVVRYRTRDGAPGVEVLTPLVLGPGPGLLVDRGWLQTAQGTADAGELPDPPSGEVTVRGYVRRDATGDGTTVTDGSTRAVDSQEVADAVGRPLLEGFVQAAEEQPPAAEPLEPGELPDLTDGPHFFYGLQWWFFALLAGFGYVYLAYDEWRRRTGRKPDPRGVPQREATVPSGLPSASPSEPETSSRNWVR